MKKLALLLIVFCGFSLSGCFESAPKCNDETAVDLVKEILLEDEWFFIKNGLKQDSLNTYSMVINMINRFGNQIGDEDKQYAHDLWEYSSEAAHISLGDFMTESTEKQSKKTYCSATLEIEYSKMPQEMRQKYDRLKGPVFDGGKVTREVTYSTRYTDDGKKIYVELLED